MGRGLVIQARIYRVLGIADVERPFAELRARLTAERLAFPVACAIAALGVWLRCRGLTVPFWLDEAAWTERTLVDPLKDLVIRPIGFMLTARALARVFGASEVVMRFMPWLAGVICCVMSVPLGRRLFRSEAARLLFVGMIAMDPRAIDFSKEYKPYSVTLTIHAALIFLALRYASSGKARDLAWVLLLALVAVLFAQDAVFAYPGIFLFLAVDTLRSRRYRHFLATAVVGALTAAIVGSLYVFFWSQVSEKDEHRWGKKYDVFYIPASARAEDPPTHTEWTLGRYADTVETPAQRSESWATKRLSEKTTKELGSLYMAAFLALNLGGLWQIGRRKRWREALLLVLPFVVLIGFNWFNFWPFGAFRANLFTVVYVAAIACVAVDREPQRTRVLDFLPVALLIFLPLFAFERKWSSSKPVKMQSRFPDVLRTLIALHGPVDPDHRDVLVGDAYTCPLYRYYAKYHPTYSKTLGVEALQRFTLNCHSDNVYNMLKNARSALKTPQDRAWVVVSRLEHFKKLDGAIPGDVHKFADVKVSILHIILGLEQTRPE